MKRAGSNPSGLATVAVFVLAGFLAASPFLDRKNPIGFVILVMVPVMAGVARHFSRSSSAAQQDNDAQGNQRVISGEGCDAQRSARLTLALIALYAAPFVGALLSVPFVLFGDPHPDDILPMLLEFAFLGCIAGFVVALAIFTLHEK